VIDASEHAFAYHVPTIVRPTANLWVELIDQIGGRHAMRSFDSSSDTIQEGSNILLGRLDEQFPVRISAHVPDDTELWLLRGNAEETTAAGRGQRGLVGAVAYYHAVLAISPENPAAEHYLVHYFRVDQTQGGRETR
jgi:hypothetical protein